MQTEDEEGAEKLADAQRRIYAHADQIRMDTGRTAADYNAWLDEALLLLETLLVGPVYEPHRGPASGYSMYGHILEDGHANRAIGSSTESLRFIAKNLKYEQLRP